MTDDETIQHLRSAPIVVPLTRRERFRLLARKVWRIAQPVCAVISVVSLAIGTTGIVLLVQLAICTNTNLGARSAPGKVESAATLTWTTATVAFLTAPQPITKTEFETFVKAFETFKSIYATQEALKAAHPLGQC